MNQFTRRNLIEAAAVAPLLATVAQAADPPNKEAAMNSAHTASSTRPCLCPSMPRRCAASRRS